MNPCLIASSAQNDLELSKPKLSTDEIAETLADFGVPWDGSFATCLRIDVDVVPAAVSMETTAGGLQFADQFSPFYTKTSISLVWAFSEGGGPSSSIIIR